ncbi:glycosyl transferase family 4-domain-containing protein [Catenaria anguillulae PL171]|uniref:UDP-N-acetylglucosamine--dolichyl-phosphate N-acetylglucosaminephosphotransferase n=1 Tax=Catenaria anguillulae PL171 TaxID=765915 RepID=A0A1Y2H937_9FUNG|nr:glycosyl transferase family 4-domain-containing protein [Catenaria anguillulae PL171]
MIPSLRLSATDTSLVPLAVCAFLSATAYAACTWIIPRAMPTFLAANLKGADLGKKHTPVLSVLVTVTLFPSKLKQGTCSFTHSIYLYMYRPESMGLVTGLVYLLTLCLLMPALFLTYSAGAFHLSPSLASKFPSYLSALLSISAMLFLGFADDVLNIRWRHKLFLPAFAALPMLFVYAIESGVTWVVVPAPLRSLSFTPDGSIVDLGFLYYVYMLLVAIFATNSINILAGINGVEAGQSLVIALSLILNSLVLMLSTTNPVTVQTHLFALYLLVPFVATSAALVKFNWFPARVFVGDTFTYFAGMVLAVVGILGHFSKTLLLFFLPQIFNFVLSVPQLFHLVPCPRHRLPRRNDSHPRETLLQFSTTTVPLANLSRPSHALLTLVSNLGLTHVVYHKVKDKDSVTFSNLTLINAVLVTLQQAQVAPDGVPEDVLCKLVIGLQVVASCVGFLVRYGLAGIVYP